MDDARRKLRICLICVVIAAVIMGVIYYVNDIKTQNNVSEGTLVRMETGIDHMGNEVSGKGILWGKAGDRDGVRQ